MLIDNVSTKKPSNSCRVDEVEILMDAAAALQAQDLLKKMLRENEQHLRKLCREYDKAANVWGFQVHHLRRACEARGLIKQGEVK